MLQHKAFKLFIQATIVAAVLNESNTNRYDPKLHVNLNLNLLTVVSPVPCDPSSEIDLLYVVHTAPSHFELRNSLRQGWASSDIHPNKTRRIFLIGRSNTTLEKSIVIESQTYHDIFMYDLVDAYRNMTIKVSY